MEDMDIHIDCKSFGLTFGIKLMEKGEEKAEKVYSQLADTIPKIRYIVDEENEHEKSSWNSLKRNILIISDRWYWE